MKEIEDNMGLVYQIAKKLKPRSHSDLEDLVQIGRIALWKAAQIYDPTKGKFSTLAYRCIIRDILKEKKFLENFNYQELHANTASTKESLPIFEYVDDELQQQIIEYRQNNYTWKEIADLVSLKVYTCKSLYKKAINKIRQQMQT